MRPRCITDSCDLVSSKTIGLRILPPQSSLCRNVSAGEIGIRSAFTELTAESGPPLSVSAHSHRMSAHERHTMTLLRFSPSLDPTSTLLDTMSTMKDASSLHERVCYPGAKQAFS